MDLKIVNCPSCGTRILVKSDGTCPNCGYRCLTSASEEMPEAPMTRPPVTETHEAASGERSLRILGWLFLFSPILFGLGGDPTHPGMITVLYWLAAIAGGGMLLAGVSNVGPPICLLLGIVLSGVKIATVGGIRPIFPVICLFLCILAMVMLLNLAPQRHTPSGPHDTQ